MVVSVNSWQDISAYMSGKTHDMVLFWASGVPVERLLKAVEDYGGNLLVYSACDVFSVMRSRFSRVLRGRQPVQWKELEVVSKLGFMLAGVKRSMGL
jgi:hypothetical protein